MPQELLLIEQLHISVFVPPGLSESTIETVHQTMNANRLWDKLQRTVLDALEPQSHSFKIQVEVSC